MTVEEHDEERRRRQFFNTLLFETPGGQRFTQDSPVLANVWLAFAERPHEPVDLILTVARDASTGHAAKLLRRRVTALRRSGPAHLAARAPINMAYLPGQIAARLYFDELMSVVLPLTPWWRRTVGALDRLGQRYRRHEGPTPLARRRMPDWSRFPVDENGLMRRWTTAGLMLMRRGIGGSVSTGRRVDTAREEGFVRDMPPDFIWLVRIGGIIADLAAQGADGRRDDTAGDDALPGASNPVTRSFDTDFRYRAFDELGRTVDAGRRDVDGKAPVRQLHISALRARIRVVRAFFELFHVLPAGSGMTSEEDCIWRVTKNRTAELAVTESSLTVKADAARRLFDISCQDITWAVVDSGIDGRHPAFRNSQGLEGATGPLGEIEWKSRVVRTYDFTNLRDLLDPEIGPAAAEDDTTDPPAGRPHDAQGPRARHDALVDSLVARRMPGAHGEWNEETRRSAQYRSLREEVESDLDALHARIRKGQDIDWETLDPLIVDRAPKTPKNDHGTHVAGILGADWIDDAEQLEVLPLAQRPRLMQGTCPEIRLYDCRVFREEGDTDEFEILAAIQFLRWLNSRAGYTLVHGANLSLSLLHEVRRFACGQTPICIECNEAAALGVVIVAAAGNRGYETGDLELTGRAKGYRAISVTDPGNADGVITVGSTHRKRPHEYGVSYFSSRGPTGDGRLKPDLVAPGEKIKGPTPGDRAEYKDGTSMAAPHVSGAAAMLMSRHKELCGNPVRIKQILCDTATDLGRDRYFQGHGLVDILRALQSI